MGKLFEPRGKPKGHTSNKPETQSEIGSPLPQKKTCRHCKKEVEKGVTRCPHCAGDLRSWFAIHPVLTVLGAFFLTMFVFGIIGDIANDWEGALRTKTVTKTRTKTATKTVTKTVAEVTKTVVQTQTVTAPPPPPVAAFGDGTHIVGTDIQPGTYRNSGGSSCYWERLSGFSGTMDDVIANDNASGTAIVTIAPSDVGFTSSRCGSWSLVQ